MCVLFAGPGPGVSALRVDLFRSPMLLQAFLQVLAFYPRETPEHIAVVVDSSSSLQTNCYWSHLMVVREKVTNSDMRQWSGFQSASLPLILAT